MYNVKILSEVDKDLFKIFDYIYENSYSILIAENIINHIYGSIYSLNFLPYRFQIVFGDIRILNIKSYRIFYTINEETKNVFIYRVLGCSQDYDSNFIFGDEV